jgi:hypothetical protein
MDDLSGDSKKICSMIHELNLSKGDNKQDSADELFSSINIAWYIILPLMLLRD